MKYFVVLVVGILLFLTILSLWKDPSHKKYSEVQSLAKETLLDEAPSSEKELSLGLEVERQLHKEFLELASPSHTFEDLYRHFNQRIRGLGFKSLDFKGNLGHSIARELKGRIYIEEGESKKNFRGFLLYF